MVGELAYGALGLPIRTTITPGQWSDVPQTRDLIEDLQGVSHVICDAAYDADHLWNFIVEDLKATAQIKPNPSRASAPETDRYLYKERHLVECFFNRIKRFHRIALRCEKTVSSFKAFVDLACSMAWIS